MMHTLEGSPLFQPVAWALVVSGALFTGSFAWNAYYQIQDITEKTFTLEAEITLTDTGVK